ncbi:MAG TPA: ABC transporter permease [Bryobacteraceae bacterium]|nr:ABC transporter permease [Bryobacteraceae bacterium]
MANLWKDLRYGQRTLRKNPGFTAVAVLTMAVGIAANTTVFSWIDSVLLHPYPGVGAAHRLVSLETVAPSGEHLTTSYPDYRDLRDNSRLLEMTLSQPRAFNVGEGVHAERLWGELVAGNFFDVMRVRPALGRFFAGAERDDAPGGHLVAVLSYPYWQHRFHGDPGVLGQTLRINRHPVTIIGVAAEKFGGSMTSLQFDFWLPAMSFGEMTGSGYLLQDRKCRMFLGFARLKPGVTMAQASAELQSLAQRLAESHGDTNGGISATVVPIWKAAFGAQKTMLGPLSILMGICGVVLLIACANVANLLLARATTRVKEFSVRLALGAPRGRLVRQLMMETLLLALGGSLIGLLLADQMRVSMRWLLPATTMPTLRQTPLEWRALLFTEALAVAVALLAGLVPAWHATRLKMNDALKEGGRGGTSGARSHQLRSALVVAEVALAVVALAGAGLFMKSFQLSKAISPGFDPRHVAVAEVDLSSAGYNQEQATIFCRRLRQDLESKPGVEAVTFADTIPLGFVGASWEDLQIEGYVPRPSENMKIFRNMVAPGYFSLMRIPLLEGRDFTGHDDDKSLPVMIVTQEFVRRFLPGQYPLGRKVKGWGKWFTIVGVAKDGKYLSFTESPRPYFYIPIRQIYRPEMGVKFYLRTAGAPAAGVGLVRETMAAIDPNVGMFGGETLSEHISAALFGQKLAASLLSALGVIALLLAGIGLYSVMAYSVMQRAHETGIRIALGARPSDVVLTALGRGMALAAIGLAIGVLAAAGMARTASATLVMVSATDPEVYGGVVAFLALVAALASWIPARRAATVDPMVCLRVE